MFKFCDTLYSVLHMQKMEMEIDGNTVFFFLFSIAPLDKLQY